MCPYNVCIIVTVNNGKVYGQCPLDMYLKNDQHDNYYVCVIFKQIICKTFEFLLLFSHRKRMRMKGNNGFHQENRCTQTFNCTFG